MTKTPTASEPAGEPTVRVYNRSTRQTFDHGPGCILAPSSFIDVPESVAKNWFRLFPDTVIEAGVAQKELGGLSTELTETRLKLAAAEKRIAELEAGGADPKAKKRIAELETALKKATSEQV